LKNKTFKDYSNAKSPLTKNLLLCALAGTTWYLQFFFYGMGESRLGNGASSWILHMAFIILIANSWGVLLKEWKGVNKSTYTSIIAGILVIILSICIVGFAKTLE
jgi:L-rhamnose-H+ transport protein